MARNSKLPALTALACAALLSACANNPAPLEADFSPVEFPLPAGAEWVTPGLKPENPTPDTSTSSSGGTSTSDSSANSPGDSSTNSPSATSDSTTTAPEAGAVSTELDLKAAIPAILARGYLVAGVDQSMNLLSFRGSITSELSGFEVELARALAAKIFGDPNKVDFRFVDSTDFTRALETKQVDVVIRTLSITPERAKSLDFSLPYYAAHKQLLQARPGVDPQRVCVNFSSTSLDAAATLFPGARVLATRTWSDCLMALQQGQVDAVLADDLIVAGLAAQDPTTVVRDVAAPVEYYGIATRTNPGLLSVVNSTLIDVARSGAWERMYREWFYPYTHEQATPPAALLNPTGTTG